MISVFLSYSQRTLGIVEVLARRLRGDARLSFWFGPWHSIPGVPVQEQMETALSHADACAVFVDGPLSGWQNEQMRTAIQTRVEDQRHYRVIPVLLPGADLRDLPSFLRRYQAVIFPSPDDETAFRHLLAGILGLPPLQIDSYLQAMRDKDQLPLPPSRGFRHGRALVVGIATYRDPNIRSLSQSVLNDARDLATLLSDPAACGYPAENVTLLLDDQATTAVLRATLADLAAHSGVDDTTVFFFSGHGAQNGPQQYLIPYDCQPRDLAGTCLSGQEMTALLRQVRAGRLLVMFDSCHSGGAAEPKEVMGLTPGLSEAYYAGLAQGRGRVVMASSRADELSWITPGMHNSLFTHYLLEALRGLGHTLGDGYVRVFDLFRHVAEHVPTQAKQHPIFKASDLENDFPVALVKST